MGLYVGALCIEHSELTSLEPQLLVSPFYKQHAEELYSGQLWVTQPESGSVGIWTGLSEAHNYVFMPHWKEKSELVLSGSRTRNKDSLLGRKRPLWHWAGDAWQDGLGRVSCYRGSLGTEEAGDSDRLAGGIETTYFVRGSSTLWRWWTGHLYKAFLQVTVPLFTTVTTIIQTPSHIYICILYAHTHMFSLKCILMWLALYYYTSCFPH